MTGPSPTCQRCGLAETRRQVVQPDIPPTMRVLFLGRDPGEQEDKAGRPFLETAPAGGLLRRLVSEVGIRPEWVGYHNLVACHTPKNRGPRKAEIVACSPWVRLVVAHYKPEVLVLVGQESTEGYLNPLNYSPTKPTHPITQTHGTQVQSIVWPDRATKVYSIYHPSAALRNTRYRRLLVSDLRAVATVLGVQPKFPPVELVDYDPPPHVEVSVDEEARLDNQITLGFGAAWIGADGRAVGRWYSQANGLLDYGLGVLAVHRGQYTMFNAKYDWGKFRTLGLELPTGRLHDVMLMAYTLQRHDRVGSLGLKELALADLGYSWSTMADLGAPEDMTDEECGEYCLYDCAATLYLRQKYLPMLEED